jgi:hypothetical protein
VRTSWLVVALLAVAGCSAGSAGPQPPRLGGSPESPAAVASPSALAGPASVVGAASGTATPPVATSSNSTLSCPPSYAAPDPKRPRLSASVAFSGGTVTGSEHIVFTPDLAVSEVVLRLWAAAPRPARAGGGIDIQATKVDGRAVASRRSSATVLRIPAHVAAGQAVTVDVSFALRLPTGINDRFGHRGTTAWFGSGLPPLAWERGHGWALEPATSAFAEASTSEAMELTSLTVRRATGLGVIATGVQVSDDGTTAHFRARSVRDVAVAVGRFRVARTTAGGVPIVVGVAPGLADDPAATAGALARAMRVHAARFGPFPYERLAVAVLPDIGGGIEYPAAILLGKSQTKDATASHEVAHEWWYGLVGDDQARDPWLDESFATYAEALDRGTGATYERMVIPSGGRGRTGEPMTFWESRKSIYFRSVYVQGAVALLRARRAAGTAAFDTALRCHLRRNAHRISTPTDLRQSLQALPAAVRVLTAAGALP